jgi:hypothetical protein
MAEAFLHLFSKARRNPLHSHVAINLDDLRFKGISSEITGLTNGKHGRDKDRIEHGSNVKAAKGSPMLNSTPRRERVTRAARKA